MMCDQTNRIIILWKDLKDVDNKSISASIKRYSKLGRAKMEALSEKVNLYYLLAILNSKYASHLLNSIRGIGNIDINPEYLRHLPIPIAPKAEMDELSLYAKEQLKQHAAIKEVKLDSDAKLIQNAIAALDSKIDKLVFKIYGLSEDEIDALQNNE